MARERLARVGRINSSVGKNAQRCACAALGRGEACEEAIGMHPLARAHCLTEHLSTLAQAWPS
jgi:hypothetical protein